MSEPKNEKAQRLQEISKSILILKDLNISPAERLEMGGRNIAKAFELGAFNRHEHITLRNSVEFRLSQKNVNPYISAWGEALIWLKYKKPPFPPTDLDKNFSADCELIAKAILDEVKAIDQTDLASTNPVETEQKDTPTTIININKLGVLGDIQQVETLQTGDNAATHNQVGGEEKKKGILSRIPYWVYLLVSFLAALFACIHYWPEIQQKLQSLFSH